MTLGAGSRGVGSVTIPSTLDTYVKVARPTVFNIGLHFKGPFIVKYVNNTFNTLFTSIAKLKTAKANMANVFKVLLYLGGPISCVLVFIVTFNTTFMLA